MKLVWSEAALTDLAGIRDFIARDSEHYAAGFAQRLVDAVDILQVHPELGQTVPELKKYKIRQLIFQNYGILYQIRADNVRVLIVVHAGRDMSSYEPRPWDVS